MRKRLLILAALATCLFAQPRSSATWTFTATGTGAAKESRAYLHTVTATPSGSPTGCTLKLEGSLDGTNWYDLSGDQACTASLMFHIDAKPVNYVRANLTVLSGGTSPSVAVQYQGVQ